MAKKSSKTEKPVAWAMGEITPKGVVIHMIGDHNTIEAASAKVNKEAGMRVAFVVDVRAVNPQIPIMKDWLAGKPVPGSMGIGNDGEQGDDEDEEGVA